MANSKSIALLSLGALMLNSGINDVYDYNMSPLSMGPSIRKFGQRKQPRGIAVDPDEPKIGRNEKCICGSNKKYKHCCLK